MAVLVTGANGFIGSHLVDALVGAGEEVRCLVRRPVVGEPAAGSRFYVADFTRADLGVADSVLESVDTVYHVAGATRAVSVAAFQEANVALTERLLDRVNRARQAGLPPRFVYISSQAAAGPTPEESDAVTESDTPAPIEAYGRSKLAAEHAVLSQASRFPVTVVRPVAVYGPGDRDFLSIFRMVRRGVAVYPGIRDATVTTIFVTDLVHGIIAAAHAPSAIGGTYFMGHPRAVTWRTIYRAVADVMGRRRFREVQVPLSLVRVGGAAGDLLGFVTGRPPLLSSGKAALAAPKFWTCSSDRATRDFGFTAMTSLDDGLRATYDWYRSHHRL